MKLSSVCLLVLASISQASAIDLRGVANDFTSSNSFTSEQEQIESTNGKTDYEKTFITRGQVKTLCFNYSEFCDIKTYGDLAWLYCFAAQKASASATAAWAIQSNLKVNTNANGRVNNIELDTVANAATLAVTFSEVGVNTATGGDADVHVESESNSAGGSKATLKAAALALGDVKASATAYASAASLGTAQSQTGTLNAQQVSVQGRNLQKFEASITSFASSFSTSSSEASATTVSKIAAGAFVKTLAKTKEFWVHDFTAGNYSRENEAVVSDSFGKAYSNSLAQVSIAYTVDATLLAEGNTIRISLKANTSSYAGKVCGPPVKKDKK